MKAAESPPPPPPPADSTPTNDALELGHTGWLLKHFPDMTWNWPHLVYLRKQLLRVTHGEVDRIAIALPAQHAKTKGTLIPYGAWRMLRDPGTRVAIGSHTQRYANKISKFVRRMVVKAGGVLAEDQRAEEWNLTNGSTFIARGVGASISGESVDCVPGDTLIHTDRGLMRVGDICTLNTKPLLLSYNHATGASEYRRVLATRITHASALVEIRTDSGRIIRCTANHRIHTARGYVRADHVRCGEEVSAVSVPDVQRHSCWGQQDMLPVLHGTEESRHEGASCLRSVWPVVRPQPRRPQQGTAGQVQVDSLFDTLPVGVAAQDQNLQGVRDPDGEVHERLLRPVPLSVWVAAQKDDERRELLDVRHHFQVQVGAGKVLLANVFQRRALDSDAWGREFAVHSRPELREVLCGDAAIDNGAGRVLLRPLRKTGEEVPVSSQGSRRVLAVEHLHSPHRRERAEQHLGEFDFPVLAVPPAKPQFTVFADRVCGVREVSCEREPVYDLQVEGNSNFFAGSILVHNCFLMDDVFGSREDADSVTIQERVYEWYMDDVTPRLQKNASLIMTNTRWSPGDLIGRIQQSEEWPEWVYVRIPAIAEDQAERDRNNASQGLPTGLPDPVGREAGRELCADRFPLEKLLQKQRIEGVGFESVYQQNPIPRGGTFFERRWLLGADNKPVVKSLAEIPLLLPWPYGRRLVRYWDLANSRHDSACYTSGVLLMKLGDGDDCCYFVCDVVRGRWMPAERNERMRQVAELDAKISGFEKTWFEQPVFDKGKAASRAIYAALSGFPVSGDNVSGAGSKELRAEPVAGAAKGGILKVIDGGWLPAFLTEVESFPRSTYKDQIDSLSGAYNRLSRGGFAMASG